MHFLFTKEFAQKYIGKINISVFCIFCFIFFNYNGSLPHRSIRLIYIYPARCMETNIDHILWPFQTKPEWLFWVILAIFNNLAIIAWLDMAPNMLHVGFYANSRINIDHQWKRNWKIYIGSKVMAKTKSGVKFWPFPLYFCLFWGRK